MCNEILILVDGVEKINASQIVDFPNASEFTILYGKFAGNYTYAKIYGLFGQVDTCGNRIVSFFNLSGDRITTFPLGVRNVDGDYLGIANNQAELIALWNMDVTNASEGPATAAPNPTQVTLPKTSTIDGIYVNRFWKFDTQANKKFRVLLDTDDIIVSPGGVVLSGLTDSINLTASQIAGEWSVAGSQSYPRAFLPARGIDYIPSNGGTVYIFHNDTDAPTGLLDNIFIPGGSGTITTNNLSGYLPKRTQEAILSTASFTGNKWTNVSNWGELNLLSILNLNFPNAGNPNNTTTIPLFNHMNKLKHIFTIFLNISPTVYGLTDKTIFPDLGSLLIPFGLAGSHPLGSLTNLPTKIKQISTGIFVNANGNTSAQNDQYFIDLDIIFNTTPNPDFPNQMIIVWSGLNNRTTASDAAYNSLISKGVYIRQEN
ncbi:MAG: hypothetical protein ACEQSR_03760 [Candidatus Methylacidiphilales bacterium]